MTRLSACPPLEDLELFRSDAIDDESRAGVDAHLAACANCRARLDDLATNDSLLGEIASVFHSPTGELVLGKASDAPSIPGFTDVRVMHSGGQGVVYKAHQRSTGREVAIKVLLPSAEDNARRRARFEREIELVSSLRHPGIVTVFDTGRAQDGRVYLVMEWIEGLPIDAFVRTNRCDAHQIVTLVAKVADAVAAAHRRGLIHRDLKPSNILVDANAEPKVVDFGLARGIATDTGATRTGEFLGTLAFASPEQVSGDPTSIDTRSDVYSLGVLLYILLAGRFPYTIDGPIAQVCNNIRAAPPAPLSLASVRRADDLSAIVSCALAKEAHRRYQSAADMSADLDRWLKDEPIMARSDSGWYLLRRAVRRHRVWVGAGAVVAAALVATAGVSFAFWRQSLRDRDEAIRAAQSRETVVEFLSKMLAAASPYESGREVRVADLLDDAASSIATDFADQPEVRRQLRSVLSDAFLSLGLVDEAEPHLEEAIALSRQLLGEEHRETILNRAVYGRMQSERGQYDAAAQTLRDSLERAMRVMGPDSADTLSIQLSLAVALAQGVGLEESETHYRAVIDGRTRLDGPNAPETLGPRVSLGMLLITLGRLDEAEAELTVARAGLLEVLGPDHARTLAAGSNLGHVLIARKNFDEAETLYRDLVERSVRVFGEDHSRTLTIMNNHAGALWNLQRYDEVAQVLERTYASQRRTLGDEHPLTLTSMGNLGVLKMRLGQLDEAETILTACLDARVRVLGEDHRETAMARSRLDQLADARKAAAETTEGDAP